jgi:cytochrome c6
MEHSMKEACKPLLVAMTLLAVCVVSAISLAQTNPGEDHFKAKCASCHGPDGAGKTAVGTALKIRDLRSDDVQKESDTDLNRIIAKGKNKMPAFDGKLKKEQIEQLVSYIRALGKKQ